MIRALGLLVVLGLAPHSSFAPSDGATADRQENLTPQQVIARLEKEAVGARASMLELHVENESAMRQLGTSMTESFEVTVSAEGSVRIRSKGVAPDVESPLFNGTVLPDYCQILAADGMTLNYDWPGRISPAQPVRSWAEKVPPGGRIHGGPLNSFLSMGPSGLETAGFLFHLLSPALAFAGDPGLALEGRRKVAGRDCLALRSVHRLRDPIRQVEGMEAWAVVSQPHTMVARYFVGASDSRLWRMTHQFVSEQAFMNYRFCWSVEEFDGPLPVRLSLTVDSSSYEDFEVSIGFGTRSVKRGLAPEACAVRNSDDLYAADPEGVDLSRPAGAAPAEGYAWVLAGLAARQQDMLRGMMAPGAPQGADHGDLEEILERILKTAWSPGPARNLILLYGIDGKAGNLLALAERMEKQGVKDPAILAEAAAALVRAGQPKRALAILEPLRDDPRLQISEERVLAQLALGDASRAAGELASMADPRRVERFWPSLTDEVMKALKPEKGDTASHWVSALDAAVAAAPRSPGAHAARMLALTREEDVTRFADAARAAFEQAPGPELSRFTLRQVKARLMLAVDNPQPGMGMILQINPGGAPNAPKIDPEKLKAAMKSTLAALEAAGSGPEARLVRAMARRIEGDRERALAEFKAVLDALETTKPPTDLHPLAVDLVTELDGFGDDVLLGRACAVMMKPAQAGGSRRDFFVGMMFGTSSPLSVYARYCQRTKNHAMLFHAMKRVGTAEMRMMLEWMPNLAELDLNEFFAAARAEVLRDPSDLEGLKWLSWAVSLRSLARDEEIEIDPVEVLEMARKRLPDDIMILQALLRTYDGGNNAEKAAQACDDLAKILEARGSDSLQWPASRVLLVRAGQVEATRPEEAAAALDRIDPARMDVPAWVAWQASKKYEALGKVDRAAEVLAWAEQEGYRPYLRMAELHRKRKDWSEAMRSLNRAIGRGSEAEIAPPQSIFEDRGWVEMDHDEEAQPEDPARLKAALYDQIGETYFIEKLLASGLPPLGAEDAKKAGALFAKLSSDEMVEREEAHAALKKMGPAVAVVLKAGLASGDEEVRTRAKSTLMEWAEPR